MCAMERRLKEKLLFKGDPKWRRKLAWKCVFGVLCFRLTVYNSVQEMWVTGFVHSLSFCFQLYLHCFAFSQVMISWVQCKHQLLFSSRLFSKHCGPRICSFCDARERKKREPKSTKDYVSVFCFFSSSGADVGEVKVHHDVWKGHIVDSMKGSVVFICKVDSSSVCPAMKLTVAKALTCAFSSRLWTWYFLWPWPIVKITHSRVKKKMYWTLHFCTLNESWWRVCCFHFVLNVTLVPVLLQSVRVARWK